jgi:hypothetical protein
VGPWKTGSTALQEFFHINREQLLVHGVYYPIGIISQNSQVEIPNIIKDSVNRFHWVPNTSSLNLNELIKSYYNEMNLRNMTSLLLSSEDFANFESADYAKLFQSFGAQGRVTFEIVFFDFDPVKRLDSYVNQFIRQGEYVDDNSYNQILESVSQIQNNFENATRDCSAVIHRIDYEQLMNSSDIYEKTLSLILNEKISRISENWSIPHTRVNSSISLEQTTWLNEFNKLNEPISRVSVERWRNELSKNELKRFNTYSKTVLCFFGYPLS